MQEIEEHSYHNESSPQKLRLEEISSRGGVPHKPRSMEINSSC